MELTSLQKRILNAPENKIAVEACAAALKTSTLTEKTRQLLRAGVTPSTIAVITFTRMAAQELIDRLDTDYKEGIFVGTIHALAARFLSLNGLGGKIKGIAEEEDFDKLFELCLPLKLEGKYDWILVDETQDCGELELQFIFDKLNPPHYFVCLDYNQSIYGFRGARPDLLKKYLNRDATFYNLNENFRNGFEILDYAKGILSKKYMVDDSIAMQKFPGIVEEKRLDPQDLVSHIQQTNDYKEWAVLCRLNRQMGPFKEAFDKANIPYVTFRQGEITRARLEQLMAENSVKILTMHSSKGLAWDNVAVAGCWWGKPEEYRLNYVAATRARKLLIMYK